MSGTSMDGIDAALLDTDGEYAIKELGHFFLPYDPACRTLLKAAEYVVRKFSGDLNKAKPYYAPAIKEYLIQEMKIPSYKLSSIILMLSFYLRNGKDLDSPIMFDEVIECSTLLHSLAVKKLLHQQSYLASQIDVIGYHGQTLFHHPAIGITLQIGNGQVLANELGISVVNNFRSRDVASGGQGAPFAPIYHQALAIRDNKIPVGVINCGGIANITLVNSANMLELIGFDTGPGNALIDRLIRQRTQGRENMDRNGQYGKKGKINQKIFMDLYQNAIIKDKKNFFQILPPKSLDYGDMEIISELDLLTLEDACRTLEAFTADTIVKSLDVINVRLPEHWILAGGGWKNPVIHEEFVTRLKQKLGENITIQTADQCGWQGQALEAQVFAYLAVRSLQNKPISVPGVTQVSEPLSGGEIFTPQFNHN